MEVERAGLVEEEENTARLGAEEVGRCLAMIKEGEREGESWRRKERKLEVEVLFGCGRRSLSGKFGELEV